MPAKKWQDDTKPEQMEDAINILKEIAKDLRDKIEENVLISFDTYGNFALGIKFIYYISKQSDIFETQTVMNLEILKRFNAKGLEFAFPTHTIYKKEL